MNNEIISTTANKIKAVMTACGFSPLNTSIEEIEVTPWGYFGNNCQRVGGRFEVNLELGLEGWTFVHELSHCFQWPVRAGRPANYGNTTCSVRKYRQWLDNASEQEADITAMLVMAEATVKECRNFMALAKPDLLMVFIAQVVRDEFLDRENWLGKMEGLTPVNFRQELKRILRHQVEHEGGVMESEYLLKKYFLREMA